MATRAACLFSVFQLFGFLAFQRFRFLFSRLRSQVSSFVFQLLSNFIFIFLCQRLTASVVVCRRLSLAFPAPFALHPSPSKTCAINLPDRLACHLPMSGGRVSD